MRRPGSSRSASPFREVNPVTGDPVEDGKWTRSVSTVEDPEGTGGWTLS